MTVRNGGKVIIDNLSFTINKGEQWAIVGSSGSGKTTLLHALSGKHFHSGNVFDYSENTNQRIILVEQQHRFKNLSNTSNFYYQQRFNSSDAEDAVTVEQYLENSVLMDYKSYLPHVLDLLKIQHLLPTRLIQLSNGENKRLQIARALLAQPSVLLLDNPLIGLDAASRNTLIDLLEDISSNGIHLIMVTAYHQLPAFITHVIDLGKEKNMMWKISKHSGKGIQNLSRRMPIKRISNY